MWELDSQNITVNVTIHMTNIPHDPMVRVVGGTSVGGNSVCM